MPGSNVQDCSGTTQVCVQLSIEPDKCVASVVMILIKYGAASKKKWKTELLKMVDWKGIRHTTGGDSEESQMAIAVTPDDGSDKSEKKILTFTTHIDIGTIRIWHHTEKQHLILHNKIISKTTHDICNM